MFYLTPVKDENHLIIYFYFELQLKNWRQSPLAYIDYLVDSKCKNSLDAFLQDHGLINSLSVYYDPNSSLCFSNVMLLFKLTPKGLENYKKVLKYTFVFLDMLKKKGV